MNKNRKTFIAVEENAMFEGYDISAFRIWVGNHVKFPVSAFENKNQGSVVAQFVVNNEGYVEKVKVLAGINPEIDDAVVKTILRSPRWKPAMQKGKPVKEQFIIPINFSFR